MKRYLFYVCATALACVATETPARAQASAFGSSFPIYGASARGSAAAYDSKNHVYLVVSAYGTVSGRFVSADGVPLPNCASGANFALGGATFGHFPRVAYSPDANGGLGGFVVTWHESDSPGGGNAVHARSVSLTSCLGPDRIVSGSDTTYWEAGPAIAYSSVSQRFLVAWRAIGGQPNDIGAQLLDLSGQPLGPTPIRVTTSATYEDDPSIAYNPSTDLFLVAFRGYDTSAFIGARTVAASTGALGAQSELTRTTATYITDTTFISSGNRYLVAWYQIPGGSTARFVNSAGVPEGAIIPLSSRFAANDAISVAYNALSDTSFMVSHDQQSFDDGGLEISASGVPGPGFVVTTIGGSGNYYPRLAASSIDKKWMLVTVNAFRAIYGQFVVTASSGGGTPPPPPPPPPPPSAAPLTITSFSANKSFPATQGTTVTWTATTSGGSNVQYQFWRYTVQGWQLGQDYSSLNSFTWTPPAGTNNVQVWVRSAGSSAPYEAYAATGYFDIRPGARVTAFFASRSFPLPVHVPVTFTATASSGSGPVEYQFWRYSASTGWILAQDYSGSNSYSWFPLEGLNAMQVWVRTAGSAVPYEDYSASGMFTVSAAAVITGLSANVPFPALPGTPITWTASATSGGGTIEYKFWGYNAALGRWAPMRDWGVSNQLTWTPGLADLGQFAIQVWVRDIGASLAYEDWRGTELFTITQSTSLTLTMNRSLSGLRAGDSVTFSAQATGGTGNWEYAFWGYNGSAWVLMQPYTVNQNNFSWGVSAGTLAIQVWIRAPGSNAQWERWATTQTFVVTP